MPASPYRFTRAFTAGTDSIEVDEGSDQILDLAPLYSWVLSYPLYTVKPV